LTTGDDQTVVLSGRANGGAAGVSLGAFDQVAETTGNILFIDIGGKASSIDPFGVGVSVFGNDALIVNDGTISGRVAGIYVNSNVSVPTRIVNHGSITGNIAIMGDEGAGVRILRNSGHIEGTAQSYGYQGDSANFNIRDVIYNRGEMVGSVTLRGNDDSYFGAGGHLTGRLSGGSGNDELYDGVGGNIVDGGDGNDTISGGLGADTIIGGAGTDVVIYGAVKESTFKNPDIVKDITRNELDVLDLRLIDANEKKASDQAFHVTDHQEIGGLWFKFVGQDMFLYGETDGDKQIDFAIKWLHHDTYNGDEVML
jgi:Ca2+-binding RTX toxin-like protein